MGICTDMCENDHSCSQFQKCCSNGCGHTCVDAVPVSKQGVCPAVQQGMVGICSQQCSGDEHCEGDKKCCSNGCGHVCVDAEPCEYCHWQFCHSN